MKVTAYVTAKNSLKQLTLTVHGLIFGRAYYWKEGYLPAYFREGLFYFCNLFIYLFIGGSLLSEFYGTANAQERMILKYIFFSVIISEA